MKDNQVSTLFVFLLLGLLPVSCREPESRPPPAESMLTAAIPGALPSPSAVSIEPVHAPPLKQVDLSRRPDPSLKMSVLSPDDSLWYAFDVSDDIGGSPPGSQSNVLYRLKDGQVSHYVVQAAIHILEIGPDGALYVGAGCGLLRFSEEELETLLEITCEGATPVSSIFPLDIAFGEDGQIWVGGAFNLASYDGKSWQEYNVSSVRVAVGKDGSIWTRGWDGRAGSECCLTQLSGSDVMTYTWSADIPADVEVLATLVGSSNR
ncbi:MAG: hypothetical protein WA996_17345 [Candidatus Promineifilaceae bacterium]